jgi:hypothetical protein
MGDKCPSTRAANVDQLEAAYTEWKAARCCVPELLYALFFRLYTLFFLADQNCCCCKFVLRTAESVLIYVQRFCALHQAKGTSGKLLKRHNCSFFGLLLQLYHYYFNYFSNYSHYCKSKFCNLGWNSFQKAGNSHHPSRGIVARSSQQQL